MYKPIQKMWQRGREQQIFLLQSWKSQKYMGSNREKSNCTIAILENLNIWCCTKFNFLIQKATLSSLSFIPTWIGDFNFRLSNYQTFYEI